MHNLEPYYNWRQFYTAEEDESSPFYGRKYSEFYYENSMWPECLGAATRAIRISEKNPIYISESKAWGHLPYDLGAVAAYNLGIKNIALEYGQIALSLNPQDERLIKNVEFYKNM